MNIWKIGKKSLLLVSAIGILTISAISALLSSTDQVTNRISGGRFDIKLLERKWTGAHESVVPGEVIEKDPLVSNEGETDAYVFLEVVVPYYSNVRYETDNEGHWAWGNVPSVKFINSAGEISDTADFSQTVNDNWYLIDESNDSLSTPQTHTYIYAYVENAFPSEGESLELKVLPFSGDTETLSLFDKIKFFNARSIGSIPINDEEDISGRLVSVDVYAHGIQVEHLKGSGLTTTDPSEVWSILSGLNGNGG